MMIPVMVMCLIRGAKCPTGSCLSILVHLQLFCSAREVTNAMDMAFDVDIIIRNTFNRNKVDEKELYDIFRF